MQDIGLTHIALKVIDLRKSYEFYSNMSPIIMPTLGWGFNF